MLVRREAGGDAPAIARVIALAFPTPDTPEPVEVALVDALRRSNAWLPRLSLVAVAADEVVGHVVCSRAWVGADRRPALGLGPIAVRPDRQRQGTGSALMHAVLGGADATDEPLVGVLGEPDYYGRFGFVPAAEHGIDAPDASWGAYFQVRALASFGGDLRGRFRYAPPFEDL